MFIIIVVLIISMNIIVIITEKVSEMVMMKRTSTFCFVKRDSQSSSFEQIEQDLPKSRHCKILLQAGPRPDKPEFTRKSIILKSSWIIAHFSFSLQKNIATPVPEFSFNIETSTVIGDFLDNYLRKWKKSSKTYFEIVSFVYLCVAMSLENGFSQKKTRSTILANMLTGRWYRLLFERLF